LFRPYVPKGVETFDTRLLHGYAMCFVAWGEGIEIMYERTCWYHKGWGVTTWEITKDIDGTTMASMSRKCRLRLPTYLTCNLCVGWE